MLDVDEQRITTAMDLDSTNCDANTYDINNVYVVNGTTSNKSHADIRTAELIKLNSACNIS